MDERFQLQVRNGLANGANVIDGILSRENDAGNAQGSQDARAAGVVHRHLGRPMELEPGIHTLNEVNQPDVLDDRCVYTAIDGLAQQEERVDELVRFEERIEREIDTRAPTVCDAAGARKLIEGELRPFIPSIEPFCPEIDGVRAIRDGGANGLERAGGGEKLWDAGHGTQI